MNESIGKDWRAKFKQGEELKPEDFDSESLRDVQRSFAPKDVSQAENEKETPTEHAFSAYDIAGSVDTKQTILRDSKGAKRLRPKELFGQGMAAMAGLALVASAPAVHKETKTYSTEMSNEESGKKDIEQPGRSITVETGKLAGRKVGSLFALYLGLKPGSVVPQELHVDFGKVLEGLWDKKIRFVEQEIVRMEGRGEDPEKIKEVRDRIPNLKQAKLEIVGAYKEKWNQQQMETLSMGDVIQQGDGAVQEVNDSLNWSGLNSKHGPFPRLSDNAVKLVGEMANRTNGKMILAYSLTELMPSVNDSEMNANEYEFLLENAGAEFIASAPAVYDHWLSFGSLQFTSLALRHDSEKTEGASLINQFMPKDKQIESSVKYASSFNSQLKAGQLFAIYNIGRLIQDILKDSNKQRKIDRLTVLFEKTPTMDVALLQYIASAHHNPGGARRAFEAWLDQGMNGKHSVHATKTLAEYIVKSNGNYKVLAQYD